MNLKIKKFTKVLLVLIGLGALFVTILLISNLINKKNEVIFDSKCIDTINIRRYSSFGSPYSLVGCLGALTLEEDLEKDWYQIYDHKNRYPIARIKNKSYIKNHNQKIFLIQLQEESNNVTTLEGFDNYYASYYINGKFEHFEYVSLDDVPKYLSVDINAGNVTIYPNNLEEIPDPAKSIFQELEQ